MQINHTSIWDDKWRECCFIFYPLTLMISQITENIILYILIDISEK